MVRVVTHGDSWQLLTFAADPYASALEPPLLSPDPGHCDQDTTQALRLCSWTARARLSSHAPGMAAGFPSSTPSSADAIDPSPPPLMYDSPRLERLALS